MNIDFVARKVELTDAIRELATRKLAKIDKYFNEILDVRVELAQERHLYVADLFVHGKDFDARATAQNKDIRSAIQEAVEKLEIQARKAKTRLKGRKRQSEQEHRAPDWAVEVLEKQSVTTGQPRIIKTSSLRVKPMSIEEAALQLESSAGDFIVFLNAATDKVNVLYRRRDGNLGLITPEL